MPPLPLPFCKLFRINGFAGFCPQNLGDKGFKSSPHGAYLSARKFHGVRICGGVQGKMSHGEVENLRLVLRYGPALHPFLADTSRLRLLRCATWKSGASVPRPCDLFYSHSESSRSDGEESGQGHWSNGVAGRAQISAIEIPGLRKPRRPRQPHLW
jgi:hypothetical protein